MLLEFGDQNALIHEKAKSCEYQWIAWCDPQLRSNQCSILEPCAYKGEFIVKQSYCTIVKCHSFIQFNQSYWHKFCALPSEIGILHMALWAFHSPVVLLALSTDLARINSVIISHIITWKFSHLLPWHFTYFSFTERHVVEEKVSLFNGTVWPDLIQSASIKESAFLDWLLKDIIISAKSWYTIILLQEWMH